MVTITLSKEAALVAHDNLYELLREEDGLPLNDIGRSLQEVVQALEAVGVSSR